MYADYNLFFGNIINKTGMIDGGTHDVIGDPTFTNPIGHVLDVGINPDRSGNARPDITGFDIGAYQYTGALFRVYLPLTLKNF